MRNPIQWLRNQDLDTSLITRLVAGFTAFWLLQVVLVWWAGYPGVICMTPAFWLLATALGLWVGIKSESPGRVRMVEAAVAGAIFGLLTAVLSVILSFILFLVEPDEIPGMVVISLGVIGLGPFTSAGLAWFTAWRYLRRVDLW